MSTDGVEDKKRILVVENDVIQRDTLQLQLEESGYECQSFEHPILADIWLWTNKVDLIVTDHEMPGMSGLQFLDNLRSRGILARTPVVALSGNLDPELKEQMIKNGAFAMMTKPFHFPELLTIIQHALTQTVKKY